MMTHAVVTMVVSLLLAGPEGTPAPNVGAIVSTGRAALDAGDWMTALDAFNAARAHPKQVSDRAGLLGNIALCLERLKRPREALAAFRETRELVLESPAPADDPQESRVERVNAHLARLSAQVARLHVTCDAEPVRLTMGTDISGQCPETFELDPGTYTITTLADIPVRRRVTVAAGTYRSIRLPSMPAEPAPPTRSNPEAGDESPSGWVAVGVGVGVAIAGGVALVVGQLDQEPARLTLMVED